MKMDSRSHWTYVFEHVWFVNVEPVRRPYIEHVWHAKIRSALFIYPRLRNFFRTAFLWRKKSSIVGEDNLPDTQPEFRSFERTLARIYYIFSRVRFLVFWLSDLSNVHYDYYSCFVRNLTDFVKSPRIFPVREKGEAKLSSRLL